ncbi:MAG: hypothetical protein ACR2OZ_19400 [Verrucomicrobiales bacterium]
MNTLVEGMNAVDRASNTARLYISPLWKELRAHLRHYFGVRTNDRPCSKWTARCAHWLRDGGFLTITTR